MSRGHLDPPHAFKADIEAFKQLVGSLGNLWTQPTHTRFVKKWNKILEINIPRVTTHIKALAYESKGLIGQFIGLWPSPRQIELQIVQKWQPLIKWRMKHFFCVVRASIFPNFNLRRIEILSFIVGLIFLDLGVYTWIDRRWILIQKEIFQQHSMSGFVYPIYPYTVGEMMFWSVSVTL
jgi:hypothetical protein